jgi:hypothetical protein
VGEEGVRRGVEKKGRDVLDGNFLALHLEVEEQLSGTCTAIDVLADGIDDPGLPRPTAVAMAACSLLPGINFTSMTPEALAIVIVLRISLLVMFQRRRVFAS